MGWTRRGKSYAGSSKSADLSGKISMVIRYKYLDAGKEQTAVKLVAVFNQHRRGG